MKRPVLNEVFLGETMDTLLAGKPSATMTMSRGQWDNILQGAYEAGWTLLEVDDNGIPVRAYRKKLDS